MKRVLAIILSLVMITSMTAISASASDMLVEITGKRTDSQVAFSVNIQNESATEQNAVVFLTSFENDGTFKNAEKFVVPVAANAEVYNTYVADISSQENVKILVWDDSLLPEAALTVEECEYVETLTGDKIDVTAFDVWATNIEDAANPASNAVDGSLSTKWGVTEADESLNLYLGGDHILTGVSLAFASGSSSEYIFSISASEDGENFTYIAGEVTSSKTNALQTVNVAEIRAKYVKVTLLGAKSGSITGISEVEVYGYKDNSGEMLMTKAEMEADWHINAIDELTYTNYTPALGGQLYAETGINGVFLYDNVSRDGTDGAGGVMAQKELTIPADRGDYEITFDLEVASSIAGSETSASYSGISLTDGPITGAADLDNYSAIQIRLDNAGSGKLAIKRIVSNYFNEQAPIALFENTFNKDEKLSFSLLVSPLDRSCLITVSDSVVTEKQLIYFNYTDAELTRSSSWTYLEANTLSFNTGVGAKTQMTVNNINLRDVGRIAGNVPGAEPANGIVRLEATRLSSYPTSSGDYYGRYIYHNGADNTLAVAADKNPAITRFVERRGLIGTGVSLEAVTMPGYFVVAEMGDAFYLKKLENTGDFYARATFYKEEADNVGYYTGSTYTYRTYLKSYNSGKTAMENKYLYDTTSDYKTGTLKPWKMWGQAQATFYLRSEVTAHASDNFYGNSISSQWWTNYPWKANNPTNDSYNFTALISKNNVIVENGELFLKATKIGSGDWQKDLSGETGKYYSGDFGKTGWYKWAGYVGVVSIQDKVYNRQCYLEGSFKQPNSPVGYWNAFWLTGRDSWPPEIDIFETLSKTYGHNAWHTAIHGEGDTNNLFGKQTSSINVATGYHTFALDWGYDYVKFYVDGNLFQRGHNHATINFQKNMRLILNTGVGGWETEPDDTMVWNDGLRCRYIRSFQY